MKFNPKNGLSAWDRGDEESVFNRGIDQAGFTAKGSVYIHIMFPNQPGNWQRKDGTHD